MNEANRKARNAVRLTELHPVFARQIRDVISRLEIMGERPRIQDAWRSPEMQLVAYQSGHSKVRWGYHNATAPDGTPEALAVDLLDDDSPLAARRPYLLKLAAVCAKIGWIETGILWGLPSGLAAATAHAIHDEDWTAPVKIGWDPTHVEPADCPSVAAARAGWRPTAVA